MTWLKSATMVTGRKIDHSSLWIPEKKNKSYSQANGNLTPASNPPSVLRLHLLTKVTKIASYSIYMAKIGGWYTIDRICLDNLVITVKP